MVHGSEYTSQLHQLYGFKPSKTSSSSLLRCAFCFELKASEEKFHLAANNPEEMAAWVEGVSCLLEPKLALQTQHLKEEVERMLNLEMRMRMLEIPGGLQSNLPVPELPKNFDWIPEKYRK